MARIAVIGSGAWGTALALSLHRSGNAVALWSHSSEVADEIASRRENRRYLPGVSIPGEILATTEMPAALDGARFVLCVTPSQALRHVAAGMKPHLGRGQVLISATKGIETATGQRMSQVLGEVLGAATEVCVLSGPSFAQEVAAAHPTAVVLAAGNPSIAAELQQTFANPAFRVYTTDDVAGVEFGGALKNVIAIASGIVSGLGLGANSAAALITRGLAEITRLAVACGGRPETLAGLAGMGDLVLTATGGLSRNRSVGLALGAGQKLPEILAAMHGKIAEGVETTRAALALAERAGVEMPIAQQVSDILNQGKVPQKAMAELMSRPGRGE